MDSKVPSDAGLPWTKEEIAGWSPKRRDFLRVVTVIGGGSDDAMAQTTQSLVDQLRNALLSDAGFRE